MYVRQAKQFLRNAIEGFDERKYGFASVVDLLRAAAKEGVLRIERDRQGAVRVFPGGSLAARTATPAAPSVVEEGAEADVDAAAAQETGDAAAFEPIAEPVPEPPIVEGEAIEAEGASEDERMPFETDEDTPDDDIGNRVEPAPRGARKRRAPAARAARSPRPPKAKAARPRSRKTSRP
jgi:hypothetical protein